MKRFLFFNILIICSLFCGAQPRAEKGVLDIRGIDFNKEYSNMMLPLDGEWEFYWKRLYDTQDFRDSTLSTPEYISYSTPWAELPQLQDHLHAFGYATLRLQLICDEDLPSMSLYLPIVYSAYDLYVNGEGFEGNGIVGNSLLSSVPYWRPSSKVIELKPGVNELLVHISNFRHHKGGAIKPIMLGSSDQVNFFRNFKISSTLFLAGCLLIAGALAFGFYWFNPSDLTGLFFFLFCGSYMYRLLGTDQYVIHAAMRDIPWSITLKLEYISLFLSVIFFSYFIRNLIQPRVKIWVFHSVALISIIFILLTIFLPIPIFTSLMDYYLLALIIVMVAVGISYMKHINWTHKTTYVTTAGCLMLFTVAVQKILEHFGLISENLYLTTTTYVTFIFCMAIAMTIRFGRSFRESNVAARMAARSKEKFLNNMSHELRTPMNAILGMTDILENSPLEREQREHLRTIRRSGESLLSIIMDILSLTDVESKKAVLEIRELNIEECINGAYKLSAVSRKPKVGFSSNIDSRIPEKLNGDSIRIKQILMHLLSNAFKFTEEGMVKLDVELISKSKTSARIKFTVADSGIGIDEKTRSNIFSAFSQADDSSTRKFGGAGLGLTVVKQMLELMGSNIELHSIPGKGSKFWFSIDLNIPEHKEEPQQALEVNTDLRILYAEDNPVNQKLLLMMMKRLDIDIDLASNGKEAWEKACNNQYDIILMDIQMPEMDGVEACRRIVEDVEVRPVIIAVTANASVTDRKKCFEAGMNDFISKPIKANALREGILKWQSLSPNANELSKSEGKYIQLSS